MHIYSYKQAHETHILILYNTHKYINNISTYYYVGKHFTVILKYNNLGNI